MAKDRDYVRLIHTTRWLRLRRDALTEHPLCEACEAAGTYRAACEVHHIRPVQTGRTLEQKERLMYDPANLRCLCHDCHKAAHRRLGSHKAADIRAMVRLRNAKAIEKLFGGAGFGGEEGGRFLSGRGEG